MEKVRKKTIGESGKSVKKPEVMMFTRKLSARTRLSEKLAVKSNVGTFEETCTSVRGTKSLNGCRTSQTRKGDERDVGGRCHRVRTRIARTHLSWTELKC